MPRRKLRNLEKVVHRLEAATPAYRRTTTEEYLAWFRRLAEEGSIAGFREEWRRYQEARAAAESRAEAPPPGHMPGDPEDRRRAEWHARGCHPVRYHFTQMMLLPIGELE